MVLNNMPGPVFLEGDRLNLRLIQPDNYELLVRYYNDPSVRYQAKLMRDPSSVEDIEDLVKEDNAAHFVPCRDETPIGHVMLSPINMEFRGAFRGVRLWVSALDGGFDIFHGSFEHDFSKLTEPGSRSNRVVEAAT